MPLFEIDKDSICKATADGHLYCTTTPDHPNGEKRKDRKKRYVYYHRAVKELELNRYLDPEEEVHHKDENPCNNDPTNLVVQLKNDHARGHSHKKKFWKKSPRNKPRKKKTSALRVAQIYLKKIDG
jgi:hypothetical protein